jgi:hypothetical protein
MARVLIFIGIISVMISVVSCSVRPVYNDQEQALARQGVTQFHESYNLKDYDALYSLLSAGSQQAQPKEVVVPMMRQTEEKWGQMEATAMVSSKVFAGPPIQVRTIYNTTYEKGKAQEWFIWASDGRRAKLLQYQIFPGWADPEAIKSDLSK